jgi:PKD repeat protein
MTPLISGFFGGSLQMNATATAPITDYASGSGGTPPAPCTTPPVANFVVVVTSGRTVQADPAASTPNSGVCNISGYNWNWGDGNLEPGSASSLNHTYAADGLWTITLTVTNQAGPNSFMRNVTVPAGPPPPTCAKPTANFFWSTTGNGANKVYTYTDASTVADPVNCPITDWLWTFDGGTQSNAQNPAPFSYGNNSNHPVTLKVTNLGGFTTITKNS